MSKGIKFIAASAGWALLLFSSAWKLEAFPGLHYDEAWAFNFSWRIAHEPGFWPLTAMSPYTAPWAHYWAAAWLRLLGPSLLVFRASQLALSLGGLATLALALPRHVRAFFPWACLLLPGLLLNHRFSVELNGFHALCFGAFCLANRERWFGAACFFALLGTTAHILFYAVPLGLLGAQLLTGNPLRARRAGMAYFALAALFFARVATIIPEKGKGIALVASALAALVLLAAQGERWPFWRLGVLRLALLAGSFVFFLNAVFFGQGVWSSTIYSGYDFWSNASGAQLVNVVAQGGALFLLTVYALLSASRERRSWFLCSLLLLGLMMLKPAPRYFELAFLGLAALVTLAAPELLALAFPLRLRSMGETFQKGFVYLLLLFLVLNLRDSAVVTVYGAQESATDTDLRFAFFKDSSRDFLDKQDLVRFLGSSGCARDDIQTHDPRLKEELDALALGDWPVATGTKCLYSAVARRTEAGARGKTYGEFLVEAR